MKVGVTVPNMWGVEDAREMLAMGPLAERLGDRKSTRLNSSH